MVINNKNTLKSVIIISFLLVVLVYAQTATWVYRYNGPDNNTDIAYSVIYGADGNIYAAGKSSGIGTDVDFIVVSLTTSGDTNWIFRYNGLGNGEDIANAITYGDDNNIYVAGKISNIGDDFAVISLTPAGDTNWVYSYNGPVDSNDVANVITYGEDGNIYAAGYSMDYGTHSDFTVISLDTDGNENWVYRRNGSENWSDKASSIVYGSDNNIYVAGFLDIWPSIADFTVLCLDTIGTEKWIYARDGMGGWDEANSICYGLDGNIYAAGLLMTFYPEIRDMFTVASLDTAGSQRWVYMYPAMAESASGDYRAQCITYGLDNNIYACGVFDDSITSSDFAVVSLDTAGDTNWTYSYNGTANSSDGAHSIVYGADAYIYSAGFSNNTGTGDDIITIKLDTLGNASRLYKYNGPGNANDQANSIVYGADNNIYIAGYSVGEGTAEDFIVISLDTTLGIEENSSLIKPTKNFNIISSFFQDKISIRFANQQNNPLEVIIYNILGQSVYEKSFSHTPALLCLNDKNIIKLSKGIYFLKVTQSDKLYTINKIIKL